MTTNVDRFLGKPVKIIDGEAEYTGVLTEIIRESEDPFGTNTLIDVSGLKMVDFPFDNNYVRDGKFFLKEVSVIPLDLDGKSLPEEPGVYEFSNSDGSHVTAELSDEGLWFAYPFDMSVLDEVDLLRFDSWQECDLNPEAPSRISRGDADLIALLANEMSTEFRVSVGKATGLAYKLVVTNRIFGYN